LGAIPAALAEYMKKLHALLVSAALLVEVQ
jgi:hypothetical protein